MRYTMLHVSYVSIKLEKKNQLDFSELNNAVGNKRKGHVKKKHSGSYPLVKLGFIPRNIFKEF